MGFVVKSAVHARKTCVRAALPVYWSSRNGSRKSCVYHDSFWNHGSSITRLIRIPSSRVNVRLRKQTFLFTFAVTFDVNKCLGEIDYQIPFTCAHVIMINHVIKNHARNA